MLCAGDVERSNPKTKSDWFENVSKAVSDIADIRRDDTAGKVARKVFITAEI